MNERNKIYDYIDGNLKESEKSELFKELSVNKDMREEFEYANSMSKTLNDNKDLFILPSGSKGALFSQLGLNLGKSTAPATSFFASKTFIGTVSSLITFALLSTFYFVALNKDVVSNPNESEINYFKLKEFLNLPNIKNDYVNSIEDKSKIINSFASIKNEKSNEIEMLDNNVEQFAINKIDLDNSNLNEINFLYHSSVEKQEINFDKKEDGFDTELKKSSFYLEWNNSINQNLPEESISPSTLQNFNNNNLALYYKINNDIDLGFEVRQENFFQKYEDKVKYYEQTPNFTTYSIAIKYNFWNEKFFNSFSNYTKIQFGANNGGVVSRFALGANYELYNGFYFNTNLEYSNLLFKNDFNNFNSHKISINYGIKYNF